MSDFKAKMHQIRFLFGLCPRPAEVAFSAPQTLYLDLRGPTSKGEEGLKEREGLTGEKGWRGVMRKGGEGGLGKWEREEGRGKGRQKEHSGK